MTINTKETRTSRAFQNLTGTNKSELVRPCRWRPAILVDQGLPRTAAFVAKRMYCTSNHVHPTLVQGTHYPSLHMTPLVAVTISRSSAMVAAGSSKNDLAGEYLTARPQPPFSFAPWAASELSVSEGEQGREGSVHPRVAALGVSADSQRHPAMGILTSCQYQTMRLYYYSPVAHGSSRNPGLGMTDCVNSILWGA
ncbi:uncharacterized protein PV09_08168 [Verruconis gallopava]|uniref:Uncharacterized protein n=1 Tax=Verruconis gallopava TaxID=253628 RepID=A0A0D2A0T6_9PEZI|nr:uncharacterized protein PV09_08168 [Verruconis gallopava]KIW00278.1 hypothetical protein PV09_08168 [Verruconis gallopava]